MRNGESMKSLVVALAALGLMVGGAQAAAPSAEQKADFYKTCMGIAQNNELCTCKADAAMKLIDERMMGYVIAGMKGAGNAPEDVQKEWNDYVARSNQICKPNY